MIEDPEDSVMEIFACYGIVVPTCVSSFPNWHYGSCLDGEEKVDVITWIEHHGAGVSSRAVATRDGILRVFVGGINVWRTWKLKELPSWSVG
ncbi:hypothetical protein PsorP6_000696 [Peronosclerospora sorghi]|uniref:Uncharacterized protein n=1 Tax=Peronosclerospora sorghi TaxID=230839 RepID=A0ACC0WTI6_9STRA|nr:hypothetical protein PsorP6_000696 [Peronosclerospora sorghi]